MGVIVVVALAFVLIGGTIINAILAERRAIAQFGVGNGLQEYRERHPDCVRRGRVTCHACGGTSIWAERAFSGKEFFNHRCRTCSTVLYQTAPGREAKAAPATPLVERKEPYFKG